jgi:hypothetical protein
MAWPESILKTAVLSSDLGAPVELRAGSTVPGAFATRRSRGAHLPLAGDREMAVPVVDVYGGSGDVVQAGFVERGGGWRCSGAKGRRLPGRSGAPPSPSLKWRRGGGLRRRNVLCDEDEARAQKDLSVIPLFSGLFCVNLG